MPPPATHQKPRRRGRVLIPQALERLKKALEREFPSSDFPMLYERSTIHSYNFTQMENELKIRYEEISITSDTLIKIFRREKADLSSLNSLFNALGESLKDGDWIFSTENKASLVQPPKRSELPTEFCNLPRQNYAKFIGRNIELKNLLECLADETRPHIISIDGIGGVGKTSLAIEAAYLCWEAKHNRSLVKAPAYDVIVFTTLTPVNGCNALMDIFASIHKTLGDDSISRATPSEQENLVCERLRELKTLLIINDLHVLSEDECKQVMSFLKDLQEKTKATKAIVTTRQRKPFHLYTHRNPLDIPLSSLSDEEGIKFINQQLGDRELSFEHKQKLNKRFSGIPIALIYAIGKLGNGYEIEDVLGHEYDAEHCFHHVMRSFKEDHSLALLNAIAIFNCPSTLDTVIHVAELEKECQKKIKAAIAELKCLSLIHVQQELLHEQRGPRYDMVSITREFVLAKCSDANELNELNGWRIKWCLDFTKTYGGSDRGDWKERYDWIQSEWGNISSILKFCAASDKYGEFKEIWNEVNHFADLYGYWGDRVHWLDWLIQKAQDQEDWETYVLSLARKSWTLTMMGREESLVEARKLIDEACERREDASLLLQDYLAHNTAVLLTRQRLYSEARHILDEKEKIVGQISTNGLEHDDSLMARRRLNTKRDRAKIDFEENNLSKAKAGYQDILREATEINWKRLACYSLNKLADIAIQENEYEEAEAYLNKGIEIAEDNCNKRRQAYYHKSFANLEKRRFNSNQANKEACYAIELFEQIGMKNEADELRSSFALTNSETL